MRLPLGVLKATNFRNYFFGQTLSGFGDTLVPLALSFAVLDLTGSAAALGAVLVASRIPLIAFTLIGGAVGDNWPRRNIMLAADVVRMLAHGASALLLILGTIRLWELVCLQIVAGTAAAFFDPAASGLVQTIVDKERLREANALLSFSRNTVALAGVAASGILVATAGTGWAFAINAMSFGISGWFLSRLTLQCLPAMPPRQNYIRQIGEGLTYVRSQLWLAITITYMAMLNAAVIAPIMVLGPAVAKAKLGGAPVWAAILMGTACGSIAGSALHLRLTLRRPLAWALTVVFGVIPLAASLAIAAPVWLIVPAAVIFGAQSAFSNVIISSLIQTRVPSTAISRVSSYTRLGSLVFAPLGFAVAGWAADRWGASGVLWFSVSWIVLSTTAAMTVKDVRQLEPLLAEAA